jgi:carnitine 3-dehydrogenase
MESKTDVSDRSGADAGQIACVASIGSGSVGCSWVALFLAAGLKVSAYDPAPGYAERLRAFVVHAWPALRELGLTEASHPPFERLFAAATATEAAAGADFIQENAPEDEAVKVAVLKQLSEAAKRGALIASSTGGIPPSRLESAVFHPERFLVGHPFNPPHLIPLVEIVGCSKTSASAIDRARAFYRRIGKFPIVLRKEAPGHLANRLQAALLREAIHIVVSGIAGAAEVDAAIRNGLGARWALMGGLMTLHLAGGPRGIRHTLDFAKDAYESWWASLGDDTHLTPEVCERLIAAVEEMASDRSTSEWIGWRDARLPALIRELGKQWPAT